MLEIESEAEMLEKFMDYFERIEMPRPIIAKAESVCATFRPFISHPITTVVVTDDYEISPEKENIRRYNSLWLHSKEDDLLMECKKFVVQSNMDFLHLKAVGYLEISANEFDDLDGKANLNSRLDVSVRFALTGGGPSSSAGLLKACFNNCGYLSKFVREVFWPRLE
jgi:hypothetical protein